MSCNGGWNGQNEAMKREKNGIDLILILKLMMMMLVVMMKGQNLHLLKIDGRMMSPIIPSRVMMMIGGAPIHI
jgi:hypothetical protein